TATASGTSITYTPTSGYVGSDSFTYTATNATGTSAPATVTVTVNPLVPVANGVSATVSFNTATAIPLNITGGTPSSVAVGTAPAHGTATVSGTSITYTPTTGYSGSDSFTYKAINAGGTSAPATVSITVKPALPTAGAVTITVPINSTNNPIPLNLSGGAASSVAIAGAPSHGTVQISGLAVTYTPTAAYRGTDTFTYTATNATGTSAPAMVTIQVMSRPDPSKDQNVIGLVDSQMETAKRFAQTQIGNFQSRLENLHARLRPEGSDGMQAQGPQDPDGPQGLQRGRRSAPALVASSSSPGATNMASTGGAGSIGGGGFTGGPQFGSASTEVMPQGASGGLNPFAAIGSALTSSMGWPSLNLGGKASNFNNTGFDVWSAGVVNIGRQDDPGVNFTTSGVSFGADHRFSDDLILGVGAGFGHDRTKLGDGGRNTANDYSVSVYGSYQPLPGTFIDAIVGVGRVDMASQRYATDAGTYATAQRSGDQWFASLSGAYEFRNDRYIISPYGRLDLASTRLDATKESGAGIYNLAYLSQRVPTTKLSFGLRGETMIALESAKVRPYFRAEYQHDFENPGVARLSYADDLSGPVYQISPTGVDRSALVFGAGSDFEFKNTWSLGVRYQYSNNFGSMIMHTLGVNVRKSF
ncbi:MAG: autotransporter domain-containing protein, partial [Betaproteobacteria bacterium]|nr:autotransporter domain-containing protein [Betaproteobacteria bacterium]